MSKICPYCGEYIADTAKKCRFCGEWLDENADTVLVPEVAEATEVQPTAGTATEGLNNAYNIGNAGQMPTAINSNMPGQPYTQQPVQAQYPGNVQPGQPQVVIPPIVINNDVSQNTEVNVEQTVNVTTGESSGWLYLELLGVAGAVWWGTGKWWIGLLTFFGLIIAMQIPVLGQAICIILGLGIGLLAGVISAAVGAPVWACWVIGIIIAIGMCSINLEDRKADE